MKGRHRGIEKDEDALKMEAQAKGHREEQLEKQLLPLEEPLGTQLKPIEHENYGHQERGHQKGFGKNQGKEGMDMNTGVGTRDLGAQGN
jgi:hypothetical protein